MIRSNKNLFIVFFALAAMIGLAGCVKEKKFFETGTGDGNRKQLVAVNGADQDIVVIARNVSPSIDSFTVIEITRNPGSQAELNSPLTVKLIKNPMLISAYNSAHGTSFVELPASSYTVLGDLNAITFQPGELVKEVRFRLDKSSLSLSAQYALGFSIAEVGAGGQIDQGMKNVLYSIGIKNAYDGVYSILSGNVIRYTAPGVPAGDALSGTVVGQPDITLATTGPNTVEIQNLRWANGQGVAGIDNLRATVDPATNLVTLQALGNATLTNWAGKENKYDPATRTFYFGFRWNPTANVREYEMVIKYKGPR